MWGNLEIFVLFLMIHFINKETNTSFFLYSELVLSCPNGKLCLAREVILLTNYVEAYKFLSDSSFEIAQKHTKENVYAIEADYFLHQ